MPKIINKRKAAAGSPLIVFAESRLEIEIESLFTAALPYEILTEKLQLMEFLDAYWSLKIRCTNIDSANDYHFYFDVVITNLPEDLQKDCSVKFSCIEAKLDSTKSYQSTLTHGPKYLKSSELRSFTFEIVLSKKGTTRSAGPITRQFESRQQLLADISTMYGDETLSDFTFIVKDKEFKVHKSILAASSAVMRKMFTADYEEKKTGQCNIDDVEPNIFEALIRFMYSREDPKNLGKIAHDLYALAHYYEVESLKNVCLIEVRSLSNENAVKSHALAFKYDLKELLVDAWKIIKRDVLKIYLPDDVEPLLPCEIAEIVALREKEQTFYKKYIKV